MNARAWHQQLWRFCAVGTFNTVLDLVVYLGFTRGIHGWAGHYLVANIIAFGIANIASFSLNRAWTFVAVRVARGWLRQYFQFLSVSVGALAIVELILAFTVQVLGWPDLVGKGIGIGASLGYSFLLHRSWTFSASPSSPSA